MTDRSLRTGLIALVLLLAATLAAGAQAWVPVVTPSNAKGLKGATYCADSPYFGDYCVVVGCAEQRPLGLYVSAPVLARNGLRTAALSVDGRPQASFEVVQYPGTSDLFYRDLDRDTAQPLLAALRRGRAFSLHFQDGSDALTLSGTLRGSSRSLDVALRACPAPRPAPVANPEVIARAEITKDCASLGQAAVFNESVSYQIDLDGVPPYDVVAEYGRAPCSGGRSLYCGSGGCRHVFYQGLPEGGYREIFWDTIHGFETAPGGTVVMEAHGNACNRVGAAGCTLTYRFEGGNFRLISRQ